MLTWLPEVLLNAGLSVHLTSGWETRGGSYIPVSGVVAHHTATPSSWSDAQVIDLLIEGRPDLSGPLSQLGLSRTGRFDVIAAGRANHNGYGFWGNDSIGIEAYNDGIGEPWPRVQLDAYVLGTAAILAHLSFGSTRVRGHKETDPTRKIDPRGIDMHVFRLRVAGLLDPPPPPDDPEDSDMFLFKHGSNYYHFTSRGLVLVNGTKVLAELCKQFNTTPAGLDTNAFTDTMFERYKTAANNKIIS